jgi:hypothetical protein
VEGGLVVVEGVMMTAGFLSDLLGSFCADGFLAGEGFTMLITAL